MSPHPEPVRDDRSHTLMLLAAAANRLPAERAWSLIAGTLAAAGFADLAIGHGATMSLFYAGAIVFAAWRLGLRAGLAVVAAVIALACLADLRLALATTRPFLSFATFWTLATNATGAVMLAILSATLRSTIQHERARAATDPLTGVLNRAAFFDRLAAAAALPQARRLLLACVDLDGFKAINDERGHAAGDRLLAGFAGGVSAALAEGEAIARIGGDEFAMLVLLAPGEDADQRARRLHRHLGEVLAGGEHRVTCSVGVTPLVSARGPVSPRDDGALLAAADAAMYEVKRSGRNGVRLAEERLRPDESAATLRLVAGDAS